MKSKDITIKNILLMLLILLPILMIVLDKNGITLMNNTYVYIYLVIYLGLSVTYALVTNKTSNWLGPLVLIYLIFAFCSYTGSYSSYKSPNNKNTVIVESVSQFLYPTDLKINKRTCVIFKKEIIEIPDGGSRGLSVFWRDDSSIVVTGGGVEAFKDIYTNYTYNIHYRNMINEGAIELFSHEGMMIKID